MTALFFWFRAFAFTQVVEAPIYRRLLGCTWGQALMASTITHPFVWFVFPELRHVTHLSYVSVSILAELFAWWVEALYFYLVTKAGFRRALLVSLLANGTSVSLGLLSRALFGAP